ncbi:5'-3' exonuclease PLD3-like [Schistocerca gregaria]|uniref:5'-3' exonuclease PLD3-like n=1 Tax=Schistocerca gregaria TaxID=7010 RepID=UPI00211E4076|nr:5'-3' exonuclease PLD3-like [Schistocerca gregaria]
MYRFLVFLAVACLCVPVRTSQSSKINIVESSPSVLHQSISESTYDAWKRLIGEAEKTIEIACFYMTLTDGESLPPELQADKGIDIFNELIRANKERNVTIRVVQQKPSLYMLNKDLEYLQKTGVASVRVLDMKKVMKGIGGILHTKFILVDGKHGYVGSANMDWRALTQIKELGILIENCTVFANDLSKIFELYWLAAENQTLPAVLPDSLKTNFNINNPMVLESEDREQIRLYISSSPLPFATQGRVFDLVAVIDTINDAKEFVYFSVMDYGPQSFYTEPTFYWPAIDTALRDAAFRNVSVHLLFSVYLHYKWETVQHWASLNALDNVRVRSIRLPQIEELSVPYTRVTHSKYLVTDKGGFVTTSNCAADYYLDTGGISVVFVGSSMVTEGLRDRFLRDWSSDWASDI